MEVLKKDVCCCGCAAAVGFCCTAPGISNLISSIEGAWRLCRVEDELIGVQALEGAVLQWRKAASKGQEGQPEWFHPLRSLVQAGIPMVCHPLSSHSKYITLKAAQQPLFMAPIILRPKCCAAGVQGAAVEVLPECGREGSGGGV